MFKCNVLVNVLHFPKHFEICMCQCLSMCFQLMSSFHGDQAVSFIHVFISLPMLDALPITFVFIFCLLPTQISVTPRSSHSFGLSRRKRRRKIKTQLRRSTTSPRSPFPRVLSPHLTLTLLTWHAHGSKTCLFEITFLKRQIKYYIYFFICQN